MKLELFIHRQLIEVYWKGYNTEKYIGNYTPERMKILKEHTKNIMDKIKRNRKSKKVKAERKEK